MHLGYSTLTWYTDLEHRRWEWADNKHIEMVFATGHVPAFHLIYDTSENEVDVKIYDAFTNESIEPAYSVEVTTSGSYKYLRFEGSTQVGFTEGYYYAVIIAGGVEVLFSDVFGWKTDLSEMLKVEATGGDIILGTSYELDMEDFTFVGYFYAEQAETEVEITEEGIEKPYGNKPIFNMRNIVNMFEIIGNRSMLKFLSGLRILEVNGDVTFTWKGYEMSAYDITVEKKESSAFDESIILTLKFKEEDYLSVKNAV